MNVLVLGASGATGRLVVTQLLSRGISTRIVVRESSVVSEEILSHEQVEVVRGNITEFDVDMHARLVEGCDGVICCLGHTISFKGLFGRPHLLVTRALRNVCDAAIATATHPIRVILMNTTANVHPNVHEKRSFAERFVLASLTLLLPPQRDNVKAAKYLAKVIGQGHRIIDWVAVRPDSLIDDGEVSGYEVYETVTRSPLFDPGKTSRINVSHFMAELMTSEELWARWRGRLPVLYNSSQEE